MEEANKLIGVGKVHLVKGKVVEAVAALQEACGLLAKKYGDTAEECGEAFYWFGKALLDLARMENTVLGNALEGVPEEEDDEEEDEEKPKFPKKPNDSNIESTENVDESTRDELRVQVYDAMAEKKDGEKQEADTKKVEDGDQCTVQEKKPEDSKEKEEAEEAEDGKEEEGDDAEMEANSDGKGEGDNDAGEKESEEEEEDEVGNLQLAWEMLEVAKIIYKRKDTKEDQLMAAQTHLKLGEVSAESGNYTQALEDFKECLMLQKKHLESDSRLLAETHYQLGVTFSLNLQYKESIEELNSTISVINSRLETLTQLIGGSDADALPAERKEMEELKALLPDIQERVEDAKEGLKMSSGDAMGVAKSMLDGSSAFTNRHEDTSSISTTNSKSVCSANGKAAATPVSDISHLVRKKRKPEESPVKEHMAKKVKEEGQTNGTQDSLTEVNGHANNVEVER